MDLKKKVKSIKRNPTKEYRIVIPILIFFLIVFYTSKMWLPDADKIQSTAIGVTQRVSTSTELTLSSWEYNPVSRFMEVIITVADSKNFNRSQFTVAAKISNTKKVPAEIVLKENSMMVVHIKKVPKDFSVISLWLQQKDDGNIDKENYSKVNFKCDYRKVKINSELKSKTKGEYVLQSIEKEIDIVTKNIKDNKDLISKNEKNINLFLSDIDILKVDIKYQTEDEIEKTNSNIASKYKDIDSQKMQIEKENKTISSLNDKLLLLNLKLADAKTKQSNVTEHDGK